MKDFKITQEQIDKLESVRKPYYDMLVELDLPCVDVICLQFNNIEKKKDDTGSYQLGMNGFVIPQMGGEKADLPELFVVLDKMINDPDFGAYMLRASHYYADQAKHMASLEVAQAQQEQKHAEQH